MRTTISSISDKMAEHYSEWEETFGYGPCGAFSALKREEGWGQVAICFANVKGEGQNFATGFSHYVIISENSIVDLTNPFDEELEYSEIEILPKDEMPDLVDEEAINWLRERGI